VFFFRYVPPFFRDQARRSEGHLGPIRNKDFRPSCPFLPPPPEAFRSLEWGSLDQTSFFFSLLVFASLIAPIEMATPENAPVIIRSSLSPSSSPASFSFSALVGRFLMTLDELFGLDRFLVRGTVVSRAVACSGSGSPPFFRWGFIIGTVPRSSPPSLPLQQSLLLIAGQYLTYRGQTVVHLSPHAIPSGESQFSRRHSFVPLPFPLPRNCCKLPFSEG